MKCRICNLKDFSTVLDMGKQPLVNSLLAEKDLKKKDKVYPLVVKRCNACGLIQVVDNISGQKIYRDQDYLYYSGDMPGLSEYFNTYAQLLAERYVKPGDLVVEIGSNDGIMLKSFPEGTRILGVDPSTNVVVRALRDGIPTISDFFTERLANSILKEYGPARLVYGNNCIAHLDNLQDLMRGVSNLLTDDGVFVVECNYWGGMVANLNYSLIYHDHFSYFTATDWANFAPEFDLHTFDATVTPAQGGSLRIFMSKKVRKHTDRYKKLVSEEYSSGLDLADTGKEFARAVKEKAKKLGNQVKKAHEEGKVVAGYGAAAKGFSILSLAGITNEISYFVDDSKAKQGKYTPVTHIPVVSRRTHKDPDIFIITAPNYADIIKAKEETFKGEWIVP